MQWVIKVCKQCNLRCKYCYEWDSLEDPTRMSEDVWKDTLRAIREYSDFAEQELGVSVDNYIVWHGGEPLLLPPSYYSRVISLQKNFFDDDELRRGKFRNCIQTSLYSVNSESLRILKDNNFTVGVSLDFCSGVRVTAGGQTTERQVKENLTRLHSMDIPFQLITVLAHHTASDVDAVFQEIRALNVPTRLLPLFEGSPSRDMVGVEISHSDLLDALFRMFQLWFDAGMSPQIRPFDEGIQTVVMKKLGLRRPPHDRRKLGNEVLVVDRDGTLSSAAQGDTQFGNVCDADIGEVIASNAYEALVKEEVDLKREVCGECQFLDACDTSPISSNKDSFMFNDCVIDKPLFSRIESYLESFNLFDSLFGETARGAITDYLQHEIGVEHVGQGEASSFQQ